MLLKGDERVEVLSPRSLPEVLSLLRLYPEAVILAGGTDLLVHIKEQRSPEPSLALYIGNLSLDYILAEGNTLRLGSCCTHTNLAHSGILQQKAGALAVSCSLVGSPQIRNRGTLGGNLATASPAGDTLPALLALEAAIVVKSLEGSRVLPVQEFLLGPGRNTLGVGEIITEIRIPMLKRNETSFYCKMGNRNALAVSIAGIAGKLAWRRNKKGFSYVRLALGSVAPTVILAEKAAKTLMVPQVTNEVIVEAAVQVEEECKPISDIRASAAYRREMAGNLLLEQVRTLLSQIEEEKV